MTTVHKLQKGVANVAKVLKSGYAYEPIPGENSVLEMDGKKHSIEHKSIYQINSKVAHSGK